MGARDGEGVPPASGVGALVGAFDGDTDGAGVVVHVGPFAQLFGQLALAHEHVDVPTSESIQDEPEGTLVPHEPQPAIG